MMWRTANSKDHYAANNSILFPSSIEILLDFGSHQAMLIVEMSLQRYLSKCER